MSEDTPKAVQSSDSEIDKIRKRTPRASFWFHIRHYSITLVARTYQTDKKLNNDNDEDEEVSVHTGEE